MVYITNEMQNTPTAKIDLQIYSISTFELEDYLLGQIKNYRRCMGLDFKVDRLYNKEKRLDFEYKACDVNIILSDLLETKVFNLVNAIYSIRVVKSQEWLISIGY